MITDARVTSHFVLLDASLINTKRAVRPLIIHLPDSTIIKSTHICILVRPDLVRVARVAHIVPGLSHRSLMLIKILCNAGCTVTYKGDRCKVMYKG